MLANLFIKVLARKDLNISDDPVDLLYRELSPFLINTTTYDKTPKGLVNSDDTLLVKLLLLHVFAIKVCKGELGYKTYINAILLVLK